MKKRIFRLTVLFIVSVALFVSCSEKALPETADIRFSISNDRARTISPGENRIRITKYRFTLSGTADYSFVYDRNSTGIYIISGVIPGIYTVRVEALTADGTVVSEGNASHFFERGTNSFSITLSTLLGSQDLKLTFLWNTSSYKTTPEFSLTLIDESGNNVTIASGELTIDTATGRAVLEKSLAAGSYIVTAKLHNGTKVYIGYTDVVRLTNGGSTLESEIDFKSGGAVENSASIISNIDVPIEGTISASLDDKKRIVAVLTITSMPDGVTEDDITVTWYNEHYKLSDTAKTAVFYGMPGLTQITAVMKCSKTGAMGSAVLYYNSST